MLNYISQVNKFIGKTKTEYFVFLSVLIFYFGLWLINPGKYIIILAFIILGIIFYIKLKDFKLTVLILSLASSIISSGKSYFIQIIPPGIFDKEIFPNGYSLQFTINIGHFMAVIMLLIIIRDIVNRKAKINFTKIDFILIGFFVWKFLSDLFGSQMPEISLLFYIGSIPVLILYFYIRIYVKNLKLILSIIIGLFVSFLIFESIISFQQFIAKSPLGKNLEVQQGIEYIGNVDDELSLQYSYRPDGTFDHANTLGMEIVFWLTFIFIYYAKTNDKKFLYIIMLGLASLVITLSRSAWLGLASGMLGIIYILEKIKKIKLPVPNIKLVVVFAILLIPLIIFFVTPRIANSTYSFLQDGGGGTLRLEQISAAFQIILLFPIFGVGENMFIPKTLEILPQSIFQTVALDIHNWYISIAANHGIIAFLLFMCFVILSLKSAFQKTSKNDKTLLDFINTWYVGATLIFLTIGLFAVGAGENFLILFSAILNNEKHS